ncbi:MAG: hypothetical protein ACPGWR_25430, partial [Ardenticatenaceae bacterium]
PTLPLSHSPTLPLSHSPTRRLSNKWGTYFSLAAKLIKSICTTTTHHGVNDGTQGEERSDRYEA